MISRNRLVRLLLITALFYTLQRDVLAQTIARYVYQDELASGWVNWSWGGTVNFNTTSPVHQGTRAISFQPTQGWAGLYIHSNTVIDVGAYSYLTFAMRGTQTGQRFSVWLADSGNNAFQNGVPLENFGGAPPVGSWRVYQIPLSALGAAYGQVSGIVIQENAGTSQPVVYVDSVGFGGTPTATVAPTPTSSSLSVNASRNINPFSNKMLGMAMVNWEHSWGKPFPNNIPGLVNVFKGINVGLLRYAGGLWANSVGWDRVPQRTPYTTWTKNGNTYSFHYGINEIDNLAAFARAVGADVMIQVNIANNDPAMWADMVRYTNIEKGYGFKYWEIGNELDHDSQKGVTPEIYESRLKNYVDAMKDVDPSIVIVGGVPASAHDAPRQGYSDTVTEMSRYLSYSARATSPKGRKVGALSYHWYQACNSTGGVADIMRWQYDNTPTTSWRNSYSRIWSQIAPSRIQNEILANYPTTIQGITELNFDACNYDHVSNGNHLNALWMADVLGRLAYNGVDFVTWYEGYANQGYSVVYANNGDNPTTLYLRPSYYAAFLYANYFGDQLVESNSPNPQSISVWASRDTTEPNTLKLVVTNLTGSAITAPIQITGFTAANANIYTLSSTSPTSTGTGSNTASAPTTINGVKLEAMNLTTSAAQIRPVTQTVGGSTFSRTYPAYSATAIVLTSGPASTTPPAITPSPSPIPTSSPTTPPTPRPTPVPGDANGDGLVTVVDYGIWVNHYLTRLTGVVNGNFTGDDIIDGRDFIIWRKNVR